MAADKETREVEILLNATQANASIKDMAAGVGLMNNQLAKMSQDDPRRQQLQRDFQVLTQRVGAARAEMRTYVQTEEEMREATEKLNKENLQVILNGQKLNASYKDMKASAAQLEQQLVEMNSDAPGRKKMLDDYHALQERISGVSKEMKGATEGTSFLKQGFANAFAFFASGGIMGLVSQLFGFFASSREEFQASARSSADLEATLHATKNAAGLTADEIRKIGEERAKYTLFDDDETNRASAMLLTFKNVKKGVFEEAIPAIQDLATKMAGDGPADMKGASIQLGKALNDPIKGITALTRVGVTFSDQQKEQITTMVKAGNVAGAQKLILAELNSEFGGAAKAARLAGGGMATLTMRWNEMKETVGSFVSDGLTKLSMWFGRVLDNAQPLVDMITDLAGEFAIYYREIGDVLEGMGLFSDKTDTAKMAVDVLKGALTFLLMPLRMMLQVSKAVVDGFIDWYNKSEMLRGVLGGLGAVVVSLFTTIKDDALKILGGVGDILIGIFTLDKNKIAAGFKSALSATADLALEAGNKAADAFTKGYEANKDNRIVRKVHVETSETSSNGGAGGTAAVNDEAAEVGESTATKKARESAEKKAKQARDKADQARLNDMKAWIKQEGDLLEYRNTLRNSLEVVHLNDAAMHLEEERQKILDAATKKVDALTGLELDYDAQVTAIVADRDLRLRELAEKNAQHEEQQRQEAITKRIADSNADAEVLLAEAELHLATGVLKEQQYQDAIYAVKQAAMVRELDLIKQRDGSESVAAKKQKADVLKGEADHIKKVKGENESLTQFKNKLAGVDKFMNDENVKVLEENLGKQTIAFKAFQAVRKADAIAHIGIAVAEEVQGYWATAATMGPIAGPIYGLGMSGLAIVRGGLSAAKVAGFAKGGATGDGMVVPKATSAGGGMRNMINMSADVRVGGDGKLTDATGFKIAGVVHEDEYVIPKWLREDPQVMQVEGWLERRRLQGYAQGGATSAGGSPAPADELRPDTTRSATDELLLQVLGNLDRRLQQVEQWPTSLDVVLDVLGLDRDLEKIKRVKAASEIRSKSASN